MIYSAIASLIQQNYIYAIIALFFSLLYTLVVGRDALFYLYNKKVFKKDYGEMNWYVNHLSRMQFSFITAVGAFTAVQNVFGNTILNFTLPAFIGGLVARLYIRHLVKNLKVEMVKL